MSLQQFDTVSSLRDCVRSWRRQGARIGFVPTMGNLHAGHLSLVECARQDCDKVVASVFVNPSQFNQADDFERYPRTLDADRNMLDAAQADALFAPHTREVYPQGHENMAIVEVPKISEPLCGRFRPGHFRGVATVVTKLFNMVQPDVAFFGEKDFQQLLVIRKLTADLCFPIEIVGVATMREASGLAMSSRNRYLNNEERQQASEIYAVLSQIKHAVDKGSQDFSGLCEQGGIRLEKAGFKVEYLGVYDAQTLADADAQSSSKVIAVAAWLGTARLIDNIRI